MIRQMEDRRALRKAGILARESILPEERQKKSAETVKLIADCRAFREAGTVMIYDYVRGELSLEELLRLPEASGKRFVYPLCVNKTEMIAMVPGDWKRGPFGIREPVRECSEEVNPEEIDLVLCPCTVFDEFGNRIGMGAGYYDRFLKKCRNAVIAAVAFEAQRTERVPAEEWDYPMEMIFTEKKVYYR